MRHIVFLAVAVAAYTLSASPVGPFAPRILVDLTNQIWRYNETAEDLSNIGWQFPGYDDSSWPSGRSLLGNETSPPVFPLINTFLQLTCPGKESQTITYYFRTHFQFDGDPAQTILVVSNLIDDGYLMYLNGTEVSRFNMPSGPVDAATLALLSNPGGEGNYLVRELPSGILQPGDNLLSVEVHQYSPTSADVFWGTVLHAQPAYPCTILKQGPTSMAVLQGRSAQLRIEAACPGAMHLQWFKDGVAIPDATNNTYPITNMDLADAGTYFCRVSNAFSVADSRPIDVFLILDDQPPQLLGANADPFTLASLTIRFDEPVINADDSLNYVLTTADGSETIDLLGGTYNSARDAVTFGLNPALTSGKQYVLACLGGVQDPYGNSIAENSQVSVSWPLVFRQGASGYAGTADTVLHSQLLADTPLGDTPQSTADLDDSGSAQGLLRFGSLFGYDFGQIPSGATINSATLRLLTLDPGSPVRMLRMLVPWDESSTWNALGNGIDQTNSVEAGTTDAVLDVFQGLAYDDLDVTAAVQAWANGASNYGWAFLSTGANGWSWATSEHDTNDWRPTLIVDVGPQPPRCEIVEQPQSVHLTEEGYPHQLSVVAWGSSLTYQWYKDNVPIPGATSSTYTIWSRPSDAGVYTVLITSGGSVECFSQPAVVTVHDDPQPLRLFNALGNPDQTTITLLFDNGVDPVSGQDTATYSLSGGLTVLSAVVSNTYTSGTVILTTTPRLIGSNYTIHLQDLQDDIGNMIFPNPTLADLPQRVRLVSFDQEWRYHNQGMDLGQSWHDLNYDDSHWNSGLGLLGRNYRRDREHSQQPKPLRSDATLPL